MIAVGIAERPLDAYVRETVQRLPLADATLSLWAYVLQPAFLARVFSEYRGALLHKSAMNKIPGKIKFGKRVLYNKSVVLKWLRDQSAVNKKSYTIKRKFN